MATVGQVIDDKYEILKLIGKGGMSKVYLAMDKRLNKQWAIKEIQKNARDKNNEVVIQSAIAEANLIKSLDHPAIVRIVDIIENQEEICIIEDYIEGETLSSILEEHGAQPQKLVIGWAMQLCEALEYLHTRKPPIIYRDMKPANVMLKPDGNIKVIDFGIAREYKEQGLADTVSLGTKGYAAPEQFGGKGQTDVRTDVYCLGVTLYHLVTGHNPSEPPYELKPIRYWNPQLSAGLEAIIQKCTQQNPNDRYQSCAELLYALHHYEEYGAAYRAAQKRKLHAFYATVGVAAAGLLTGGIGLFMRNHANNADYQQNINWAKNASNSEDKLQYYAAAIDIKPLDNEAYLGMISAIKEDATFTLEEEQIFRNKVDINQSDLKGNTDYADLAYEIGNLYWHYYDYGRTDSESGSDSNQITRMKSAIPWFEDVMEYGNEESEYFNHARIYRDIGQFNRDITLNIVEASDKGMYAPYWDNIRELVEITVNNPEENEMVRLEVYRLALYSIEQYARKFKAEGVTQETLRAVFESVKNAVINIETTSDTTEKIKESISARLQSIEDAIDNAFR